MKGQCRGRLTVWGKSDLTNLGNVDKVSLKCQKLLIVKETMLLLHSRKKMHRWKGMKIKHHAHLKEIKLNENVEFYLMDVF